MANALLVVKRESPKDIKMRDLLVILDGQEVTNLSYGNSYRTRLDPGAHTLSVTNRLFTETKSFDVADGQEVDFGASNEMSGVGLALLECFGVGPYHPHLDQIAN